MNPPNLLLYIVVVAVFLLAIFSLMKMVYADCSDFECSITDTVDTGDVCLTDEWTCVDECGGASCCTGGTRHTTEYTFSTATGFCEDDSSCGYTTCGSHSTVTGSCDCGGGGGGDPTPSPTSTGGGGGPTPTPTPTPIVPIPCTAANPGVNRMEGCVFYDNDGPKLQSANVHGNANLGNNLGSPAPNSATVLPWTDLVGGMNGLPNKFSIRWKGRFNFTAGNYIFKAGSDDGNRLYFDDNLDGAPDSGYLIDQWVQRDYTENDSTSTAVSAGNHVLVYEFYAGPPGGAIIYYLSWSSAATLSVALSATPSSGPAPLDSTLSADVGGTATGTINYSFWWNCSNTSNSVATVEDACGLLPLPAADECLLNAVGYKCNAVDSDPQYVPAHSYTTNSTAKVIAERGAATPAEARTQVIITASPATIQGYKVLMPGNNPNPVPPAQETVTVEDVAAGGTPQSATANPYSFTVSAGATYIVTVTLPTSQWSVGYTLCIDSTACHNNVPTPGSEVQFDVPSGPGHYADLWWHYTAPNSPPAVPTVTITAPDYCVSGPSAFVSWTYSDAEGNPQSAYQVQVDDTGSSWNPPLMIDTGKINSSGTSYYTGNGVPPWDWQKTYKARVKVWDSLDAESAWKDSSSWMTPKHAYPLVNFTWSPFLNPSANQPIQFTDQTVFYDTSGVGQRGWSWLFGDGGSSTLQNPVHTYLTNGTYNVTETATDKDGYSCALTKPINIERPIPVWKEVSPK